MTVGMDLTRAHDLRGPHYIAGDTIRARGQAADTHFFDPDTLRYFGSRVCDGWMVRVEGSTHTDGRKVSEPYNVAEWGTLYVFVTSERDRSHGVMGNSGAWGGQRRYTVRVHWSWVDTYTREDGREMSVTRWHAVNMAEDRFPRLDFGYYASGSGARREAERLAREIAFAGPTSVTVLEDCATAMAR